MPITSPLGKTVVVSGERTVIGDSTWIAIDDTERRLETISLAAVHGYPMSVEILAKGASANIKQGSSSVALPAVCYCLPSGVLKDFDVINADEAYFAVKRESGATSGTLIVTRTDLL